jgi:hypothetical protein
VGKNTNIIEINGKKYDAKTGALLVGGHVETKTIHKPVVKSETHPASKNKPEHQVAKHTQRQPEGSHTLMRHAVKRPSVSLKKQLKAQLPAEVSAAQVVVSKSAKRIDPSRLKKAGQVGKHRLITHFAPLGQERTFEAPTELPARQPITAKPTSKRSKHKTTADLLEQAILNATSHTELPHKTRKRAKRRSLAAASAVVVLAIGFMSYQQAPNLRLNAASARAGIDARLPGNQPAGYSLGQLNYISGVVASEFRSNSDDRSYTLIQKRTNWADDNLRDSFVAPRDKDFQTVDLNGLNLYLYGNGNATWINNGIWYQIQANGTLSNQQLIDLAKSL